MHTQKILQDGVETPAFSHFLNPSALANELNKLLLYGAFHPRIPMESHIVFCMF